MIPTIYFARTEHAVKQQDLHDVSGTVDTIMGGLADYDPSVGFGDRGWLSIRITLPAVSIDQAARTALLTIRDTLQSAGLVDGMDEAIALEVYTEAEFDAREGFADTTQWMSVAETMAYLDITRQAALQQIADGKFPGAEKHSDSYRIPAESVQTRGLARIYLGWEGVDIRDEDIRPVLDPMYDLLRAYSPLRAYTEWQKSEAGKEHSLIHASAWQDAVNLGKKELRTRGYDTSAVTFSAHAMRTRGEVRYPGDD